MITQNIIKNCLRKSGFFSYSKAKNTVTDNSNTSVKTFKKGQISQVTYTF
jgi:hypothetical protein